MKELEQLTLGEIAKRSVGTVQTGPFGSQLHESDYSVDGIPVVMPKDIVEGRISTSSVARVSEAHAERLSRHRLRAGDIVYGRRGDIGRQALVRAGEAGWLCGTGCLLVRVGLPLVEPLYLHYYLRQPSVIAWIAGKAVGATLPNLNTGILQSLPVLCLPVAVQRRIAGILSAYDDLIENCQRRIRILEDMARGLYREWFVNFRFPSADAVPLVDSPLGRIPASWTTGELAALCIPKGGIQTGPFGSQLHESDYAVEGVPVVMPRDLIGFRIVTEKIAHIPESTANGLRRHRMRIGDIVYGRRGDIGRRAYVMKNQAGWFCGTGCLRIRADEAMVNAWYLFNYLGQDDVATLIAQRAHGATMPNLNTGLLSSVPIAVPPRGLQNRFAATTIPFAELVERLADKVDNLRRTRDLLLPRLLSGQISLGEATEQAQDQTQATVELADASLVG